jgi:FkbM family methyltransferase
VSEQARLMTWLLRNPRWLPVAALGRLRRALPRRSDTVRSARDGVAFDIDLSFGEMTAAMYRGTYAMPVVHLIRSLLQPGDVFIDAGANIGYLSAVAAARVGTTGAVHCFEPVAGYCNALAAFAAANPRHRIVVNRVALGEAAGRARIDVRGAANIGGNTMVPGLLPPDRCERSEDVEVTRLDDYLEKHGIDDVALIKIDVEGYELPLLRGAARFLRQSVRRPAVLCEVAPAAYPLLGRSLDELAELMHGLGYTAADVLRPRRVIDLRGLDRTTDVLFMPVPA